MQFLRTNDVQWQDLLATSPTFLQQAQRFRVKEVDLYFRAMNGL
jgi:hypothetical protein